MSTRAAIRRFASCQLLEHLGSRPREVLDEGAAGGAKGVGVELADEIDGRVAARRLAVDHEDVAVEPPAERAEGGEEQLDAALVAEEDHRAAVRPRVGGELLGGRPGRHRLDEEVVRVEGFGTRSS